MKKNIVFAGLLLCVSSFCVSQSLNKTFCKTHADTDEIVTICNLLSIEPVDTFTKVIIFNTSVELPRLQEAGRPYYYEWVDIGGGGDPFPPGPPGVIGNGINEPNSYGQQYKQYYYYADVDKPKITGMKEMKNDVDSLYTAIRYLEDLADSYGLTGQSKHNAVLSYIRSVNFHYCQTNFFRAVFPVVCGNVNNDFKNYVESFESIGTTILEYFGAFVSTSDFNGDILAFPNNTTIGSQRKLYDPFTGHADIDLMHLFASLDGIFESTQSTYQYIPGLLSIPSYIYRALVGWGGDLQTSCQSSTTQISSFLEILQSSTSKMSYDDFYADVDAMNMAFGISLSTSGLVSVIIYQYYHSSMTQTQRISTFAHNIIKAKLGNDAYLNYNNLKLVVYDMLKLNSDGTNMANENTLTVWVKYALMIVDALQLQTILSNPTSVPMKDVSFRLNFANCFVNYLWGFVNA